MKRMLIALVMLFVSSISFADLSDELGNLIGYTIVDSKMIVGWYDVSGKKGDSFDGCDYGRVIVFSNDKVLTCSGYRYKYSYRPTAVILFNGSRFKMVVNDDVYEMSR